MRTKGLIPVLVVMSMLVMASLTFARPPEKQTVSAQAIVSVHVAPVVASVPQTTGFDVIQNYSRAYSRFASVNEITDTSGATGLSTTGDERANVRPAIVLLA